MGKAKPTPRETSKLPRSPLVGDKVRVKPERISVLAKACELAGYDVDLYAVLTITKEDPFGPGGGRRLYVEGAPHMFSPSDVILAWDAQCEERFNAVYAAGWRPPV